MLPLLKQRRLARVGPIGRRRAGTGGLVLAALLLAACTGFTTGATNIVKQPDGSYSAQLNFVVSCGSGEHCSWYAQYRQVGTSTWTHVPAIPHGPVAGPVSNVSLSENATGLTAGAQYEYRVCGNSQPGQRFICVGPDDQTNTTTKFTAAAWSLQTTPNHLNPTGVLSATSCSSATACTALGHYADTNGNQVTLAEAWDGSSWTTRTTPNPSGATNSRLNAVSCTSATACIAVGSSNGATLAERWDGSTWTIQTTPSSGSLNGVSCTSATACTAVGSSNRLPLAERWDGSTWTTQSVTTPTGYGSLSAVSCTSTTSCTAVGNYAVGYGYGYFLAAITEHWDGGSWKAQTSSSLIPGELYGVSCTSDTACTAVGYNTTSNGTQVTLVERWDGSTWTIQTTPSGGPLNAVSCTSATACTAVGSGGLVEHWDGSAWTIQTTPSGGGLNGVSCTSATACTAVGSGTSGTLAERWDGSSWTIQTTANPSGATNSSLNGVSCAFATACIAVGSSNGGTFAERWNGSTWTIQPTPSGGGSLNGVSCASATACIAVGSSNGATLAERWDGSTWTIQPTPSGGSNLNAVSCASATACTAVGSNSGGVAMAERWDGSTWTIQSTPDPSASYPSSLSGVSCTSATACIAVGASVIVDGDCSNLAERWDGSSWTLQNVATPSGSIDGCLSGVSCTSATACTTVGYYLDEITTPPFGDYYVTLAERWDGSTWTVQTTPNPTDLGGGSSLNGVSCTSVRACTAVGSKPYGKKVTLLTEVWDGSTWTLQTPPTPSGATSRGLSGVSCTSAAACTAIGHYVSGGGVVMTLAERYSG
jgi:hypothetical protein